MARNPTFDFTTPRFFTAYAESIFPYQFFVDGRSATKDLNLTDARGFFQDGKFPDDFHRRNGTFGDDLHDDLQLVSSPHPINPGHNEGAGNYVLNLEDKGFEGGVRLV